MCSGLKQYDQGHEYANCIAVVTFAPLEPWAGSATSGMHLFSWTVVSPKKVEVYNQYFDLDLGWATMLLKCVIIWDPPKTFGEISDDE